MNDQQHPHINGDSNVVPITTAKAIMDNPAAAAGAAPASVLSSPHISDPGVAKLLDQLPGLVGAIDAAIKDTSGKPFGFMLMVFTPGVALHATNCNAQQAQAAAAELVKSWETDGRGEEEPIPAEKSDADKAFDQPHHGHGPDGIED